MATPESKTLCQLSPQAIASDWLLWSACNAATAGGIGCQPCHQPGEPSPERLAALATFYRRTFPDLRVEVEELTARGDWILTCLRLRGTERRRHLEAVPNGRVLDVCGIRVDRRAGGKIVESWLRLDSAELQRQLGDLLDRSGFRPAPLPDPERIARTPLPEMALSAPVQPMAQGSLAR